MNSVIFREGGLKNAQFLGHGFRLPVGSSFIVSLLVVLTFDSVALAHAGQTTIKGVVKDQQGNVVPGGTVSLTSLERNFARTQTTTSDGVYTFTAIPPGPYKLEVEATGFKKILLDHV